MAQQYSMRSPAVKRLMREAEELREATEEYYAQPLDDNLFEWHFTVRGPSDSVFESGFFHGRIILPSEYPMKPPSIILLTPSGRFEVNKKICLSISGHHPESWQPSWSIRTALLAIIGFMPTQARGALGSLDYEPEERRKLALKSQSWSCPTCGLIKLLLKSPSAHATSEEERQLDHQQKQLAKQICFKNSPNVSISSSSSSSSATEAQEDNIPAPATNMTTSSVSEAETAEAETGLRQRLTTTKTSVPVPDLTAGTLTVGQAVHQQHHHQETTVALTSDESAGQFTLYLIILISAALALLLFRRLFLL